LIFPKLPTDPRSLEGALGEFGKKAGAGRPMRAADALGTYIRSRGTVTLEKVRDQQFRVSNAVADDALTARGTALQGRLLSMAREGKAEDPEYVSVMSELQQTTGEKVRSPMSTDPQAHADLDTKAFADEAPTESLLGGLDGAWDKTPGDPRGKASAVMQRTEDLIGKSEIEDKPAAIKKAQAFIGAKAAESSHQQAMIRERRDALIEDIKANPAGVDEAEYGQVCAALRGAVFDQFQTHLDPDYRSSFRRMEQQAKKELGQEFWWGPGKVGPRRAPDLRALIQ
jgi:hypothetical protein